MTGQANTDKHNSASSERLAREETPGHATAQEINAPESNTTKVSRGPPAPSRPRELDPGGAKPSRTPQVVCRPPRKTILLVEEDAADRQLYQQILTEEGFEVWEASMPEQALECARASSGRLPDLAILDVHLPETDGFALCRLLKEDPVTQSIPVLYLSGGDSRDSNTGGPEPPVREPLPPLDWAARAMESGADGFLIKSAGPTTLLTQVKLLMRVREVEKELWTSRAQLHGILDHAPVIVFVKDVEGRYLLVNQQWERQFGLSRHQVVGQSVYDIHAHVHATRLCANDQQVLKLGQPCEFEEEVSHGGKTLTFLSTKFPLYDQQGNPYAICGISTDITDRKKAEHALRDSQSLYSSLVEHLPIQLFRKDLAGQFTFANQAFCDRLGCASEELTGRTDHDLYPQMLAEKHTRDDQKVMETGKILEEVEERRDEEGQATYLEVLKIPVRDSQEKVVGMQGIIRDITSIRRTEAEFMMARQVQQRLFPSSIPQLEGLDISTMSFGFDIGGASFPAKAIGGDYYDYLVLPDGSMGISIGDVSGHGIGPALLMAQTRAYLRAFAQIQSHPGTMLEMVNRVLTPDIEGDRFVTLLLARLDPRTRTLQYASAGHHPGCILDVRGVVKATLGSLSVPLGIFGDTQFPCSETIALDPGDVVLLLTDGVTEARAPDQSTFGLQRAIDLIHVYQQSPARQIVENLYHGVRAFCQNEPQVDDITATVIKTG